MQSHHRVPTIFILIADTIMGITTFISNYFLNSFIIIILAIIVIMEPLGREERALYRP